MYHAHFGLKRPLFDGGIAQDQSVFRTAKHDHLVERFKLALASPCSVITLTGPPGIGKTTLTSVALRASQTRLAMAWLNGLVTNGTELLELLLVELGIVAERTTRVERLQLWRQFHGEMGATESRVFVIAERADDLSVEVLRALDGLTAPDATGYTGANLILLGQAGLEQHLAAPALESLRQRIRLRARLEPFTEPELQDYLRHQAASAGGDYDHLFAPGTIATLFRHSGGVARLATHLCETALTIAADEAQKLLTPEIVERVATTILGLSTSSVPSAGVATTAASTPTAPAAGVSFPPMSLTAAGRGEKFEFDGEATDVPDVSIVDFPVLTDAVDDEPAPSAPRTILPPPAPKPAPASLAAPAPMASHEPEADDARRQIQTMRAISVAKSIDDISSSMAETLFGEADPDVLSAALAASIDESGETTAPAPPPSRPATSAPQPRKAPVSTGDDLLDLLDLTSDATLELMDDSQDALTTGGHQTANQR